MVRGTRLWWKRGGGVLPATFERWHRRGAVIRTYDDRPHEVLTSCFFPATDADAWLARVAELRVAEAAGQERRRLFDSRVSVAALVREIEQAGGVGARSRRRVVEAVLAAAYQLDLAVAARLEVAAAVEAVEAHTA